MYHEDSYLNLYGALAEKMMEKLSIGEKITLTVSGNVEELSQRESMDCVMSMDSAASSKKKSKPDEHYCVRVKVTSAK